MRLIVLGTAILFVSMVKAQTIDVDLSWPDNTVESFFEALEAKDKEALKLCIHPDCIKKEFWQLKSEQISDQEIENYLKQLGTFEQVSRSDLLERCDQEPIYSLEVEITNSTGKSTFYTFSIEKHGELFKIMDIRLKQ